MIYGYPICIWHNICITERYKSWHWLLCPVSSIGNEEIIPLLAVWYYAGLAIAWSRVRIPPAAAVYQRQLSVPSLRGRLMNIPEIAGE